MNQTQSFGSVTVSQTAGTTAVYSMQKARHMEPPKLLLYLNAWMAGKLCLVNITLVITVGRES